MIKLADPKYNSFGILVISDADIETFVCRQLRDYQKGYFDTPHPLDIDNFLENYLGIKVSYHGLSLNNSTLGATALVNGTIPIIDSLGELSIRDAHKGDIFIDCEACRNCETRIRFTLGHEAGHSQFDTNVNLQKLKISESISDTFTDIFAQERKTPSKKSPRDWMEHHANRYATYLLMPKIFVRKLWKFYRNIYFSKKRITRLRPKRLWLVIHDIAKELNVAQYSIALRLLELNLISKEMFDSLEVGKHEKER